MKILHVLPSLARGGGERMTIDLANRQLEVGHDVRLVIGHQLPPQRAHPPPDPGMEFRCIVPQEQRLGKYGALIPWVVSNRSWIAECDILHCHLTYGALLATAAKHLLGASRRPAIVESYHAVGMPIPRLQRWLHARLASQWDGLSFMTDDSYWTRFCERHPATECAIIPIGIHRPDGLLLSDAERSAYRASLAIPDGVPVIGTISRLVEERKPRLYVALFAKITALLGSDVHFLVGGDGPERRAMERDAQAAGIADRLHLPGVIEIIGQPLSLMDLYVTASVGPVPGVAGLQAAAAGVPVVAIQFAEEPAQENDGWMWSTCDLDALAHRCVQLLRDPLARHALAAKQRSHLHVHHSVEAMDRAFADLYRRALARRDSGMT